MVPYDIECRPTRPGAVGRGANGPVSPVSSGPAEALNSGLGRLLHPVPFALEGIRGQVHEPGPVGGEGRGPIDGHALHIQLAE